LRTFCGLNESSVSDVIAVDGLEAIQEAILRSAGERTSIAVAGGRHVAWTAPFAVLKVAVCAALAGDREMPLGRRRLGV